MRDFKFSPIEIIMSFLRNRKLLLVLVKREVAGRYRGSMMGLLWSFFNPLLMLAIYTFVFGYVFKSHWGGATGSKSEFAVILFIGLIIFNLFADCINRAPSTILSNINYVTKVVFPLEMLPWVAMGSALFHLVVSLLVWFIAYYFLKGLPDIEALWLPIILFPLILLIMGLSWFLASLGVFIRDINQMIGIIITAIMFLSPIFFQLSSLPSQYQSYLYFNPLTIPIEQTRNILILSKEPDWYLLANYFSISLLVAWLGFMWFQKTRKGFADVL